METPRKLQNLVQGLRCHSDHGKLSSQRRFNLSSAKYRFQFDCKIFYKIKMLALSKPWLDAIDAIYFPHSLILKISGGFLQKNVGNFNLDFSVSFEKNLYLPIWSRITQILLIYEIFSSNIRSGQSKDPISQSAIHIPTCRPNEVRSKFITRSS